MQSAEGFLRLADLILILPCRITIDELWLLVNMMTTNEWEPTMNDDRY